MPGRAIAVGAHPEPRRWRAAPRTRSRPVAGRGRTGSRARRAQISSPAVPRAEPAGTLRRRRRRRVAAAAAAAAARTWSRPGLGRASSPSPSARTLGRPGPGRRRTGPGGRAPCAPGRNSSPSSPQPCRSRRRHRRRRGAHLEPPGAARPGLFAIAVGAHPGPSGARPAQGRARRPCPVKNRPELFKFAVVAAAASLLPRGPDRGPHVARPGLFAAAAAAARTWSCPGPGRASSPLPSVRTRSCCAHPGLGACSGL